MRIGEYPPQGADAHDDFSATTEALQAGVGDPQQIPPDIPQGELGALAALGFSKPLIAAMVDLARQNGTSVEAELLRSGHVKEEAYYGAMARLLRLPFIETIEPGTVQDRATLDSQLIRPNSVRINGRNRAPQMAIVPEAARLAEIASALITMPLLGRDLAITTPTAIRDAVWATGAERRARETTNGLFEANPALSARTILTGSQGFVAGMIVATAGATLLMATADMLLFVHVLLSLLYLASLVLRLTALAGRMRRREMVEPVPMPSGLLPRYTVMVALYREAEMAGQLVGSLKRLDWPVSLIDIKLVCEADDEETITALEAVGLPPQFEIVRVPPIGPRTKPKALTYALASARGELLAIYDAEDRPHPQQLREAFARFHHGPAELACLQAPLIITNARASWLSALFSLEYSALFRGLLPMLGRQRMPLPLGGTSNHFRTALLKAVGGWDPYNVTEDADMGLRLSRMGYRSDVLTRQTLEDAPVEFSVWMAQRARWFKGWLQTWLVLMRDPGRLMREMGFLPFLTFQLLVGGMLVSALLHPLIFVFLWLGASAMLDAPRDDLPLGVITLFVMDFVNILGSYLIFLGLGVGSMIDHEKRLLGWRWVFVPFYWLMISLASWRAVIELRTRPFHWNKTPHHPSRKK
ncbi:Glycosyltransferase, catalytic subunit of cellulose synthase and poly-beta-1,6-N-acetylglucosamine synthase [Rhizobium sp. NFR07]|uniref:glycosyltransferase family 2 protein n=1 Tax=Rhizobium sp. NFR07 TaxID=1566262 RepID=UPI0008EDC614|nr:glycosyltransferase family 2 protein [Rhizobium sp. NFR07]SFA98386.1 Glycosyltransferase, catalytic subunit of cellulose synthase and poly-beta-1,6-N-acetylglucosamine synthase [Rhizobium sp. NFR07]